MARPKDSKDSGLRKKRVPHKAIELVGKKINRWTVLEYIQEYNSAIKFKVKCDCGKEAIRHYETIAYGNSISCGCYHKEKLIKRQSKPNNHSAFNRVYSSYGSSAKLRNLKFDISLNEFKEIIIKNCLYCNKEPSMKMETATGEILYNGIDRLDNDIGYVINNCVPCCKPCNIAKHNISVKMIKILYNIFKEKGYFNA